MGRVSVKLCGGHRCPDTDFTAKLIDVYPDGRAVKLGPVPVGVIRARYRGPLDEEFLEPGQLERPSIELDDIGYRFRPGHRIRLEDRQRVAVCSANQNTGHAVATDTKWRVARQTVYHEAARPSQIVLPLIPSPE